MFFGFLYVEVHVHECVSVHVYVWACVSAHVVGYGTSCFLAYTLQPFQVWCCGECPFCIIAPVQDQLRSHVSTYIHMAIDYK